MSDSSGFAERKLVDWSWLHHVGVHQGSVDLRPELVEVGIDEVRRICDRVWIYSRADFDPDFSVERMHTSYLRRSGC
jgi:hypothetical protein